MTIERTETMPRASARCWRILILHWAPCALLKLERFEGRMEAAGLASVPAHGGTQFTFQLSENMKRVLHKQARITLSPALLLKLNLESLYEL